MKAEDFAKMRKVGGWTYKKLAAELGVDWVTVWRWEKKKVPVPEMAGRFVKLLLSTREAARKDTGGKDR